MVLFVIIVYDELVGGFLTTFIFSIAVAICIKEIFGTCLRLILDDEGIIDRTIGTGKILWKDIVGAELNVICHNALIGLKIDNAVVESYIEKQSTWEKFFIKANKALGFQHININLIGLDADFEQLLNLIDEKLKQ